MAIYPTITVTLSPLSSEWLSEYYYNRSQDDARTGYQNLGSGDNVRSITSASTQFINAQGGSDTINLFGTGSDIVHAGSGDDFVFAGAGDDEIWGGSGHDTLIGFDGNDEIWGGSGNDTVEGGTGVDFLYGGSGTDELWGGANADYLEGGSGADKLFGDNDGLTVGNDTLSGGDGNDTIEGSGGSDLMYGGAGADKFVFRHQSDFVTGHSDRIMDFSHAEGDLIDLSLIDANANVSGNNAFTFANSASTAAGSVWLGSVSADGYQTVFINRDGGAYDHTIMVHIADAGLPSLTSGDFVL